jgi:hypothetical protein
MWYIALALALKVIRDSERASGHDAQIEPFQARTQRSARKQPGRRRRGDIRALRQGAKGWKAKENEVGIQQLHNRITAEMLEAELLLQRRPVVAFSVMTTEMREELRIAFQSRLENQRTIQKNANLTARDLLRSMQLRLASLRVSAHSRAVQAAAQNVADKKKSLGSTTRTQLFP